MLCLSDRRLWDFWLAQDGADYHLFYLQAPIALAGRETRHWHVSIGHAVTQNFTTWRTLPDALAPSVSEAWDDYTTWTGSVIHHNDCWYLFYTGTSKAEDGLIQRIGLATSQDLISWEKHPHNPIIELDPQWYETLDLQLWHDQAWRDPWVFHDHETGLFHAFITARSNAGPADGRGVIGHAQSSDLINWTILPPLTQPGHFGYLEVPQLTQIGTRYYLLFSAPARFHSDKHYEMTGHRPVTGTHYLTADAPLGPFRLCPDEFLVGESTGLFYSGKIVQYPEGQWHFLAFYQFAPDGSFIGELTDPMPLMIDNAGRLSVPWQDYMLSLPDLQPKISTIISGEEGDE